MTCQVSIITMTEPSPLAVPLGRLLRGNMDDSGRFFWVFWGVSSMRPASSNRLPLCSLATALAECLNTRVGEVTAGGGGMTSVKSSSSYERRVGTGQDWWAALFVSSVHFVLCTSHAVMSPPSVNLAFCRLVIPLILTFLNCLRVSFV